MPQRVKQGGSLKCLFRDLITEGVVVIYLDDILIFTESRDEHRKVLRRVLKILQDNKLYLRPEKCEFKQTKIEYLGVVVSEGKVEMDPAKIAGVAEWPEPQNQTELQSFLGFVNFYRRFMKDYSHIARPLFDIQNAKEWTWTGRERTAFKQIKGLITSEPILAAPIESRPWRLEADSSDFATGAVFSQLNPEDDKWHPVAFFSKSLSPAERNYEIHDKEMLSIIRGLEEWRHYLEVETALEGEEIGILGEIRAGLRSGTLEEPVAKAALEVKKLRGSRKAVRGSEWEEDNGLLLFRGKVYVPNTGDLRRRIVEQHHDSKVAGHPGRFKTLELVSRNYWWPNLSRYIGSYTKHCDLCLRTKPQRRMPLGELTPLEIPEERWKRISVDFIVELPQSDGYDAIMNVVDYVSKRAHFIPTHTTVSALGAANLFLQHVWKLHGLPNAVVSDRGTQFIAEFTREIYEKLGIQLAASTSYHPQTDGQTERCNQELEQYLRTYTNQRQNNWAQLLPMAEFAYNNHIHNTTQQTPFILDTGRHPRMGFEPRTSGRVEEAKEFVSRMKTAVEEAKSAIAKAQDDMKRYYDQRRTPMPHLNPGDKVWLDSSDINLYQPSKKLAHARLGPYKILAKVGKMSYRLELPPALSRLHPANPDAIQAANAVHNIWRKKKDLKAATDNWRRKHEPMRRDAASRRGGSVSPPTIAVTNPGRIPNPGANAIRTTRAPITILRRPTPLP
ncbi:hypothetical protein ONZ45_g12751 [Pleurotus djamor]|nr:hypothetical protein ONZ45_g12751 [Pleurotus djamor]